MSSRVAIVTGAGKGIGRATAVALAGRGDRVLAVSRTGTDLRSLAEETGVAVLVESVATAAGCVRIVEEGRRLLGPIQILVNNAGTGEVDGRIWELEPDAWHRTMAVNLTGPFELTRLVVPDMLAARWGRIVMVSSTAGSVGGPAMAAYTASKHGLEGLMRAVAQDVAPFGVTCNAVAPGWVRTPMAEQTAAAEAAERGVPVERVWRDRAATYAANRVVAPAEVAAAIAFLASDAASAVSGETIRVALGGMW